MSVKKIKIIALSLCAVTAAAVPFSGCRNSDYRWARKIIDAYYYKDINPDAEYNGSVKDFVRDNLDIYSAYYTADEYDAVIASNSGKKSGIGVSFRYVGEGVHPLGLQGVLVENVVGNSNAYYSGLKVGEVIRSATVDGETTPFDSTESFSSLISGTADGKTITLHCDRHPEGHEVCKSEYTSSYCSMATSEAAYSVIYSGGEMHITEGAEGIAALPEGAAYLRLDQFYGNAANEIAELIKKYNALGCTSLILDLRRNGGGYVSVMQDIAAVFVGALPQYYENAMYAVYKNNSREAFPVNKNFRKDSRLAAGTRVNVLADNGTASASEALLGVLVDNEVIDYSNVYVSDFSEQYLDASGTAAKNRRTYGKGIMQTTYTNRLTGDALKLTTARIFWPKGETCIHDRGLAASDGCKTVPTEWCVTYGDTQLNSAISMIYAEHGDAF